MKKLISMFTALLLVCALCVPALAANTYSLDLTNVYIDGDSPAGIGRVVVEGEDAVERLWARIVTSYIRSDGTTWMQTVVYAVDPDMEFVMPYIETGDTVTCVGIVILNSKDTGPAWAGYNVTPPTMVNG